MVVIITRAVLRVILQGLMTVRTAFFAAAVGTIMQGTLGHLFASRAILALGTPAAVFAS